ncbi:MAG: metal-dependent hydrolase [Methanomicrobiales archaeon]
MFIEHIVYSAAIAVIVGMIFVRFTGRDPSWIIILLTYFPDLDEIGKIPFITNDVLFPMVIHHGDFHTLGNLLVASLVFAVILHFAGMRYFDGFICSAIGLGAHFFEDALVYNPAYAFFWPLSSQKFGIGLFPATRNFFGVANTTTLLIGVILFLIACAVRTYFEGKGWYRTFFRFGRM